MLPLMLKRLNITRVVEGTSEAQRKLGEKGDAGMSSGEGRNRVMSCGGNYLLSSGKYPA